LEELPERFEDSTIDYWKLQAPFICSLRQPAVSLDEHLGFQGRISPVVYLSALGWSSNLNIHLRGNIQISALLDFILGIIGRTTQRQRVPDQVSS